MFEVIFGSYPVQKLNTLNQRMKNLEDDNKRLAARNENLIDEIRRINKKYGRETWSEPSSDEDRRQVYMNGEPASVVPVIYTNLNIAEKKSVIITGGTLNGTTLSNVSQLLHENVEKLLSELGFVSYIQKPKRNCSCMETIAKYGR